MTVQIVNCLCCGAPYVDGAYLCDCYQTVEDDCKECWNCRKHCKCVPTSVHPLEVGLYKTWAKATENGTKE